MTDTGTLALREAVQSVPEASWTDRDGQLWTSRHVLDEWTPEQLNQRVTWGEDQLGTDTIRAVGSNGHPGQTILTMEPPSGWDIASPPPA